jgi:flagellar basal-body rod protein FlgB
MGGLGLKAHPQNTDNYAIIQSGTAIADIALLRRVLAAERSYIMAFDTILGIHASALQLRAQRMNMLASNIANAATPNYKARDLDFAKALEMVGNGHSAENAISYRIPIQPSLDGNTVELPTEQTAFAENALAYRSSLSFLSGRISTLTRAIRGE